MLAARAVDGSPLVVDSVLLSNPVTVSVMISAAENAAPTAVSIINAVATVPENTATTARIRVADIVITDDGLGTNTLGLSGLDAASFEIIDGSVWLKAGTKLDYEIRPRFSYTVEIADRTLTGSLPLTTMGTLLIGDVEEFPSVTLTPAVTALVEGTVTNTRIRVADLDIGWWGRALQPPGTFQQPVSTAVPTMPTAYLDVTTGVLQIHPADQAISLFNFTYNSAVANVDLSTPGPFLFAGGTGNPGAVSTNTTARTLPAGPWALVTTFPARLAGAVSLSKTPTLATSGPYSASNEGWLDRPWSFGSVVAPQSLTPTEARRNFVAVNTTTDVGLGQGRGLFQYVVNGMTGGSYGPVVVTQSVPVTVAATLTGSDADWFEIDGGVLYLKAGLTLDHEARSSFTVTASLPGASAATFTLVVSDTNESPTTLALAPATIAENAALGTTVGDFQTGDPDAGDSHTYTLVTGPGDTDNAAFQIVDGQLRVADVLDYESGAFRTVRIRSTDAGGLATEKSFTVLIADVNEAPSAVALTNVVSSLPENTPTTTRIRVADIVVADDALGSNTFSLQGTDAANFELLGSTVFLKAGAQLDYEARAALSVVVQVVDTSLPATPPRSVFHTLMVTDVADGASTLVTPTVVSLAEGTTTTNRIRVADLTLAGNGQPLLAPGVFQQPAGTSTPTLPTAYFDVSTGVLQVHPAGRPLSLFNFTFNASVANVGLTTPGPFLFVGGTGNPGAVSSDAVARTLPAGTWTLVTTFPARLAGAVSLSKTATLATIGPYTASSDGWLSRPWSFGSVITPQALSATVAQRSFVALNTPTDVGYGPGRGLFQYAVNNVAKSFFGEVIVTASAVVTATPTLSGPDASLFELDGSALYLKPGLTLDYESRASYTVTAGVAGGTSGTYTLSVADVNEAPTAVTVANAITTLTSGTSSSRRKLADIIVADDALGNNTLSLSGLDAVSLEIDGATLYLRAGVVLDSKVKSSYDVTVSAQDSALVGSAAVTTAYSLTVVPATTVAVSGTPSAVSTPYGTASPTTSVIVSGTSLVNDIVATAPAGFEVSFDNGPFGTTAALSPVDAKASGTLFVRLRAAADAGTYSGNVSVTTTDAPTVVVAIPTSTVTARGLIVTAANAARAYGGNNPAFSATVTGFAFADTAATMVTGQALVTTAAVAASNVGTHPVTPTLGTLALLSRNYAFAEFRPGTLTINKANLAVVFDARSKVLGEPDPSLTFATLGLLNGTSAAAIFNGSSARAAGEAIGTYTIDRGTLALKANGMALNYNTPTFTPGTFRILATPRTLAVTGVFVKGSAWGSNYLSLPAFTTASGGTQLGFQLGDGALPLAKAKLVTWNNTNRVSIRFSEAIATPASGSLSLVAVTGAGTGTQATLTSTQVVMSEGNTVATWTTPTLQTGKYLVTLQPAAITSLVGGKLLDGEWTSGISTFVSGSGNGTAGGTFQYQFRVLVGDANASGTVISTDLSLVRSALNASLTGTNFRYDMNGSGTIIATDANAVTVVLNKPLPTGAFSPTLTAASNATVDLPFSVTFTDDTAWRNAISSIKVAGTVLPSSAYDRSTAGQITFTPSASTLLQSAGTRSIAISATGYADVTVSQVIAPGAATMLAIVTQPGGPSTNGGALAVQPKIRLQDRYGNAVTTGSATVTAAVEPGTGAWSLGGTLMVTAIAGLADFAGLTALSAGGHIPGARVRFSSGSLSVVVSDLFTVPG
jgi:hypothetical protein